jgi:hypothetical protein
VVSFFQFSLSAVCMYFCSSPQVWHAPSFSSFCTLIPK